MASEVYPEGQLALARHPDMGNPTDGFCGTKHEHDLGIIYIGGSGGDLPRQPAYYARACAALSLLSRAWRP